MDTPAAAAAGGRRPSRASDGSSDPLLDDADAGSELSARRTEAEDEKEIESYAPTALWLETALPKVGGGYTKVMGQMWNGAPLWQSEKGYWLYQKSSGIWAVAASRADMRGERDVGITSARRNADDEEGEEEFEEDHHRMPHTIERWYMKGREDKGTHVTANPDREVTVQQLLVFLVNDNMKCRHYKHIPYYALFVFFITFTVSLLPNGLYGDHHNSEFWVESGIRSRIGADALLAVGSDADMWSWVDNTVSTLWSNKVEFGNVTTPAGSKPQYFERALVADQGRTLATRSVGTLDECKLLCDSTPGCQSITFSELCRTCFINDKCVSPFEAATVPSPACNDLRSYYRPCDNTPTAPPVPTGPVDTCSPNGVTYSLNCSGVIGSAGFACKSGQPNAVAAGDGAGPSLLGQFNFAIGYVLLRQFRVEKSSCPASANAIPPDQRGNLPVECAGRWANREASAEPYGDNRRFVPDRNIEYAFGGPTVRTSFSEFTEYDKRFTIPLFLGDDLQTVRDTVSALRDNYAWFDFQTRLVYLEAMFFVPNAEGLFVYANGFVEFIESGVVRPGLSVYAFSVLNLDSDRYRLMFALDILILVSVVLLALSFARTIHHKVKQARAAQNGGVKAIGLWDFFDFIHIGFCILAIYFRWWLWHNGRVLSSSDFYDRYSSDAGGDASKLMFNWLSQYAQWYDWQNNYMAAAIVLSYLRMFKYIQFNQRLNKLSETVKGAFADLIGMVVIFFIVLFAFSLGGTLMYGASIPQFRMFSESLAYLVRLLFTADMEEQWEVMVNLRPSSTWIFLTLFFLISWLLLLNMVLAIIAGSFAVVQESLTQKSSWTFTDLTRDIWKYVRRFMCRRYQSADTGARQGSAGGGLTYTVTEILLGRDPQGQRYTSIISFVRTWADAEKNRLRRVRPDLTESMLDDSRLFISALSFRTVCRMVDPPLTSSKEIDRLFSSAAGQVVSGTNTNQVSQERKFTDIGDRIDILEKKIETAAMVRQQLSHRNIDAVEHTNRDIVDQMDDRVDGLTKMLRDLALTLEETRRKAEEAAAAAAKAPPPPQPAAAPAQLRSPPRPNMPPELVTTMRAAGATGTGPTFTPAIAEMNVVSAPSYDEVDARRRGLPSLPASPRTVDEEAWPALRQPLPATYSTPERRGVDPTSDTDNSIDEIDAQFAQFGGEGGAPPANGLARPPSFRKHPFSDEARMRRSLNLVPPGPPQPQAANGNPLRIGSGIKTRVQPPNPRGLTTPSAAAAGLRPDPRGQPDVYYAPDGSKIVSA